MNLRCDCISCKYIKQKSTEDPCYRCYNASEYVYDGKEYNNFPQSEVVEKSEPFCPHTPAYCDVTDLTSCKDCEILKEQRHYS